MAQGNQPGLWQRAWVLGVGLALSACQAVAPLPALAPAEGAPGEVAGLEVPHLEAPPGPEALAALAQRPGLGAMDAALPATLRRHAPGTPPRFQLQAPALSWTQALGGACSNTPTMAKPDVGRVGPGPYADEYVYVLMDNGTVTKRNPSTGAVLATRALGGSYSRSAIQISGDNRLLYLANAAGTFTVLRATDLNVQFSGQVSYSGFTGSAPFIDYANGGGFPLGAQELVTMVANDGSVVRMRVNDPPASVNPSANVTVSTVCYAATGTNNATNAMLPSWTHRHVVAFAGAQSAQGGGIAWNGEVWFGTQAGMIHRLVTSWSNWATAPTLTSWNAATLTNATGTGMAITVPPAVDFGPTNNISAAFFPVADRLVWIDPSSATPNVSPPLVLDKVPAAPANYQGWLSNFSYTTTQYSSSCLDWVCISSANNPAPTRWGAGSAVSGSVSAGIVCATIKRHPITGRVWAGQSTTPGQCSDINSAATIVGTYLSNTANVNEIEFDAAGNCYYAHGASRNIFRADPNGNPRVPNVFTLPAGNNALWPHPDNAGNLWCTSFAGKLYKLNAAGTVTNTIACASAMSVDVDAANSVYVCRAVNAANNLLKYNSAGALQWQTTVGSTPEYVCLNPLGTEVWTANYGANTVSRVNAATGLVLGTYAVPVQPWAIAFDSNGDPWVSCLGPDSVNKMSATTGAILASYTIAGSGNPYELTFDGNGDCWVSCANGTYKLLDMGNLADLFGSQNASVVTDGINSRAMVRFRMANGTYGARPPRDAFVRFTAATTPTAPTFGVENLTLAEVSPYVPTTSTIWTGFAGVPTVNWNNRPSIGTTIVTKTGQAVAKDVAVDFAWSKGTIPLDKANTTDPAGGVYAYGLRAEGKILRQVAHWYSNTTAPAAAQRPTLFVNAISTPNSNATGMRSQPGVGTGGKVYVLSSNALFELDYNAATNFSDPGMVAFNLTSSGRVNTGPVFGGSYYHPRSNVALNGNGQLIAVDHNPTTGAAVLNLFSIPFATSPTTDHLQATQNLSPGTGLASQQLLWDYPNGSAYLTTASNHAVKATIWQ